MILDQFIDRTLKRESSFYDGSTTGPLAGICHLQMDLPFCEKTRQVKGLFLMKRTTVLSQFISRY